MLQRVFLLGGSRTPVGSLLGTLKDFSAIELSIASTRSALAKTGVDPLTIDQVILGNVISAGLGQNPARQVSLGSGINPEASCLNINKVCASGMKSVMFGAQSLMLGNGGVVLAGGFESMTNAPHILNNYRKGHKFGDYKIIDSLAYDGLTDPYRNIAMGFCGEHTVREMGISREMQDEYCMASYQRALDADKKGIFANEIASLTTRRGDVVDKDEEPLRFKPDKITSLKPVFVNKEHPNGTITSANASKINDGACSLLIANENGIKVNQIDPRFEILSYADAEMEPMDFNKTPSKAIAKALERANLTLNDVNYFEINEVCIFYQFFLKIVWFA